MSARIRPAISLGMLFGCLLVAVLFASSCRDASESSVSAPAVTATDNTASSGTDPMEDIPSDSTSTLLGSPRPSGASPTTTEQSTTTTAPAPTTSPPTTTISTTTTTTSTTLPPVTPDFEPGEFDFSLSVGGGHSCILLETGNITCWGANNWGQLGNGDTEDYIFLDEDLENSCPESDCNDFRLIQQISLGAAAVKGIHDAVGIATGSIHTCAHHTDSTISCWGNNSFGQLGNGKIGDNESSAQPLKVADIADATIIATGSYHNCALHADGTVSCWGSNENGELGNGQAGDGYHPLTQDEASPTPAKVSGITNAIEIVTGWGHTCVLHADRTVSCWGDFGIRQTKEPSKIENVNNVRKIVGESDFTCALHIDGTVTCWGDNSYGQINGLYEWQYDGPDSESRLAKIDVSYAVDIAAGSRHTCVLRRSGSVVCWGNSRSIGMQVRSDFDELPSASPPRFEVDLQDAIAIIASRGQTCALHDDKSISCWGQNHLQSLLERKIIASAIPVKVHDINNAVSIAAGWKHTCALLDGGTVSCWGNSEQGKLGNPTSIALGETPVMPYRVEGAVSISSNYEFTCVLHQSGNISCWGNNWAGQLGNGATGWGEFGPDNFSPWPVYADGISDAIQVAAGGSHTCSLNQDKSVSCWGSNNFGTLGNGKDGHGRALYSFLVETDPVKVLSINSASTISAGLHHTCALHTDGTISCWGLDNHGQLGDGESDFAAVDFSALFSSANIPTPVKVKGIANAKAIALGTHHSCALHNDATVSCWGNNLSGQLGDGTTTSSDLPIKVSGISDVSTIAAGDEHTCVLHTDSTVSCWGNSRAGKLGTSEMKLEDSRLITGLDVVTAAALAPNEALLRGSFVINEALEPAKVPNITDAVAIATGWQHTCAAHRDGTVSCWGDNRNSQLGDSAISSSVLPINLYLAFS